MKKFNISTLVCLCAVFLHTLIHECEAGCRKGQFRTSYGCEMCAIGTYNNIEDARYCKQCPIRYTTDGTGARSYTYCKPKCGKGYHHYPVVGSTFGFYCQVCPQGHYSDTDNARHCTACPQGQLTSHEGSTSASQCLAGRTCVNGCPSVNVSFGDVSYSASAVGGRYPPGTIVTYTCEDRPIIYGDSQRTCQPSGLWTGSPAVCYRTCERLGDIANGHFHYYVDPVGNYGRYKVHTKVRQICDNGYSPTGWGTRKCHWSGKWEGWTGECQRGCRPIWKTGVYTGYNEGRNAHELYPYGTKTKSSCSPWREWHYISGTKHRTCKSSGDWDGSLYTCARN